ncbi:hypothetical protein PLCT1_02286 [Planctomycetaceae bacterium]|nr:hypothetical protein PLCT1_02286 [Planctomycetaceae bacterium]
MPVLLKRSLTLAAAFLLGAAVAFLFLQPQSIARPARDNNRAAAESWPEPATSNPRVEHVAGPAAGLPERTSLEVPASDPVTASQTEDAPLPTLIEPTKSMKVPGCVCNAFGEPLPNATVVAFPNVVLAYECLLNQADDSLATRQSRARQIHRLESIYRVEAKSDAAGSFELGLVLGWEYEITASKAGFCEDSNTLLVSAGVAPLKFDLLDQTNLALDVRLPDGSRPDVAKVHIEIASPPHWTWNQDLTWTPQENTFSLPPGQADISCRAGAHDQWQAEHVEIELRAQPAAASLTILLVEQVGVIATVYCAGGLNETLGVELWPKDEEDPIESWERRDVNQPPSDKLELVAGTGEYALFGVDEGEYWLLLLRHDRVVQCKSVSIRGGVTAFRVDLDPELGRGFVRVTVLDSENKPITPDYVSSTLIVGDQRYVGGDSEIDESSGTFRLWSPRPDLREGETLLTFSSREHGTLIAPYDRTAEQLTLRFGQSATLRVEFEGDAEVLRCLPIEVRIHRNGVYAASSGGNGACRQAKLACGQYSVEVCAKLEYSPGSYNDAFGNGFWETVTLLNQDVTLGPSGATLRVDVSRFAFLEVRLTPGQAETPRLIPLVKKASGDEIEISGAAEVGRLLFGPLPHGAYKLRDGDSEVDVFLTGNHVMDLPARSR